MSEQNTNQDIGPFKIVAPGSLVKQHLFETVKEGYVADINLSNVRALYVLIRATSADRLTRNYSYFPKSTLLDKNSTPDNPLGAQSYVLPYPKPMLVQHRASDQIFGSEASKPNGRVVYAAYKSIPTAKRKAWQNELYPGYSTGSGYLRTLAAITDPETIRAVLAGEYNTVSIGGNAEKVFDSITGKDLRQLLKNGEAFPEHSPGDVVDNKLAYRSFSGLVFEELSWVNSPADTTAGVEELNLSENRIKVFLGEKKVGEATYNFYDLDTKQELLLKGGFWTEQSLVDSYNPIEGKTIYSFDSLGYIQETVKNKPEAKLAEKIELTSDEKKLYFVWTKNPDKLSQVAAKYGYKPLLGAISKIMKGAETNMDKTILKLFDEASKESFENIITQKEDIIDVIKHTLGENLKVNLEDAIDEQNLLIKTEVLQLDTTKLQEIIEKWTDVLDVLDSKVLLVSLLEYVLAGNEITPPLIVKETVFDEYKQFIETGDKIKEFSVPLILIEGTKIPLLKVDGFSDRTLVENTLEFYGVNDKTAPLQLLESLEKIALGEDAAAGNAVEVSIEQFLTAHEGLQKNKYNYLNMLVALARKTNTTLEELEEMSKPYNIFKEGALTLLLKQITKEEVEETASEEDQDESTSSVQPLESTDIQAKPIVTRIVDRKRLRRTFKRG